MKHAETPTAATTPAERTQRPRPKARDVAGKTGSVELKPRQRVEQPVAKVTSKPVRLAKADPPAEPDRGAEGDVEAEVVASEPSPVEEEYIPAIWELSEKAQTKLKGLKINIHVYHKEPSDRYVFIDMRRYREGDRLTQPGLILERITRDGVIIDYGEGQVRLRP